MARETLTKIIIFLLILAFYGSLLAHKINLPTDDLGRHLENGKLILQGAFGGSWAQVKGVLFSNFYSYTAPDYPFLNHHWLSGVIFYIFYETVGFPGLVIFKVILLLLGFALLFCVAAKKGNFWLAALFSIPAIFILTERTDVRPEIFSYFFTALFLYFLFDLEKNPERKRVFWLLPLQLLWTNLHIFFFIGIVLCGGFLAEKIILNWRNIKNNLVIKKLFYLLICLFAVSFVNPSPIRTFLYPLGILKNYGYDIVENKSPLFLENLMHDPAILPFKIMVLLVAFSFVANLRKKPVFFFLAAVSTAAAGFLMIRNLPFFALISLPAASINFADIYKKTAAWLETKKPKEIKIFAKIMPLVLALLLVFLTVSGANGQILNKRPGIGLADESQGAGQFFKDQGIKGPVFNNYDIGSYLLWYLFPQEKVFVENRPEAYPIEFFTLAYIPMQHTEQIWQEQLKKYDFNVIFFTAQEGTWWGRTFLANRLIDPIWALIFADSQALILLRNDPENKQIIDNFQITKENIAEKIAYLKNSPDIKKQLAASNLFELVGRDDLALGTLGGIKEKSPKNGQAWLQSGYIESKKNDLESLISATNDIETAIGLGEGFPSVYDQLGLVYFRRNWFDRAKAAWQRALDINPSDTTAKDYLEQYQKLNLP